MKGFEKTYAKFKEQNKQVEINTVQSQREVEGFMLMAFFFLQTDRG